MNIVKLQNMLRGVADDALINYVQNPTGEVPSYLALSELKRRQEVRDSFQKEQQAPESSVAEDLTQSPDQGGLAMLAKNPTPQGAPTSQGVADLPVDDSMYQQQSFATGGIVAFADGGETAEEDYYDRFKADVGGISDRAGYKHKFLDPDKYKYKPVKRFAGPDGSYVIPSKTPSEYYQGIAGNKDIGKSFMFNKFASPYDEAINYYSGLKQSANDPEAARQLDNAIQELQMQKYKFVRSKEDPTEIMTQTGMRGSKLQDGNIKPPLTLKDLQNKIAGNTPPNAPDKVKEGATGQKQDEPVMAPDVDVKGDLFAFDERPEDVAGTERARFKEMYGEDPFVKRAQTRLEAMDTRAKTMEDQNLGMALMAAGFKGMQGTSPYALVNLGAGAEAGLKQYGDTQKQIAELDEKRFNVDAKIAEAQRAVETAAINHGFKSEEYNKAANDLKKTEILKGKLDIKKYETLAGTNETKMIMAQKQNFQRDLTKWLQDNWNIKKAIETYNNKQAFDKLTEIEKQAILKDVNTYDRKMLDLKSSYPWANMDTTSKDPQALLRLARS